MSVRYGVFIVWMSWKYGVPNQGSRTGEFIIKFEKYKYIKIHSLK